MFHSRNQVIDELKVYSKNDLTEVSILDFHLYPAADTLTIYFAETLLPNFELIVNVKYSTSMMTYEAGFYQTSYVVGGEKKYLGATQFQATDARFAFPHYDEPALKSTFDLMITHDESLHAIANTFGEEEST
jgi:aminopeptidase N